MGSTRDIRLRLGGDILRVVRKQGGTREDIELVLDQNPDVVTPWGRRIVEKAKVIRAERDTVVHLDRSLPLTYPEWVKEPLHPELENTGPAEYDLAKVELWLHDGQKGGKLMKVKQIYEYLTSNRMLETCLGLRDGLAIQKKGITLFRQFFGGGAFFLLKAVARLRNGHLRVPYLYGDDEQVVLDWDWLGGDWGGGSPVARLAG